MLVFQKILGRPVANYVRFGVSSGAPITIFVCPRGSNHNREEFWKVGRGQLSRQRGRERQSFAHRYAAENDGYPLPEDRKPSFRQGSDKCSAGNAGKRGHAATVTR